MGVAKAALEASVRYLAYDPGAEGIRVNAIFRGPIKTLAARAVAGLGDMLKGMRARALKRNVDPAKSAERRVSAFRRGLVQDRRATMVDSTRILVARQILRAASLVHQRNRSGQDWPVPLKSKSHAIASTVAGHPVESRNAAVPPTSWDPHYVQRRALGMRLSMSPSLRRHARQAS